MNEKKLASLIRSAGYFNQKAKKIKVFAEFFSKSHERKPTRRELLSLWGIGPETADSILLYAYKMPEFVVDAYTKSFLIREKIFTVAQLSKMTYDCIKSFFEKNLSRDHRVYNEYHALIVEHEKSFRQQK